MAIVRYAGNRMTGVSGDTKPSSNLITGTTFHETNTDDLYIWDGDSWNIVAGDSIAQTLANKTLTAPVLNGALSGTAFLDEDNMSSDSATAVASQQSIKAYVQSLVSGTTEAFKTLVVSGQDNIVADASADTLTIVAGTGMVITNNASTDTITFTVSGITTVGALNSGSITSGFGAIDTGSSNITTTGTISAGTLVVTGTTTTVNSTTMTVVDPLIHLQTASGGGNLSSDTNKDVGIVMEYHNGSAAKEAFLGWDDSAGKLTFVPDASITSEVVSGSVGTIVANLEGNVTGNVTGSAGSATGNAATATALATARTIGGTSFDGSANIAVALAATATTLATARTIGGTSFDGSANIVPATITVADTTDTTSFVGLFESATGDLAPKTDAGITYNAGTGMLTATGFTGPLTGTADVATVATTVTITANESTNEDNAIIFTSGGDVDGGNIGLESDGTLTYNPSTGTVTATTFVGALTGTASTATVATTVTTAVDTTDDSTAYVLLANAASGDQAVKTHAKITYDTQYGILNGINEIRVEDAGSDSYGDPSFCFAGDATTGIGRLSTGAMYMSVAAREICTMHYTSDFGRFMKFEQKTGGNHQSICFDSVINVDHKSNGISMEVTVGNAGLGFMDCAYVDTAGKFASADASATGTMPVVAFHPHGTKTEDEVTRVIIQGIIRDDTWNWTIGGRLYVSETTGDLTQTAPSDDGDFIQVVGIALTADSIYFNPSLTTIESAG